MTHSADTPAPTPSTALATTTQRRDGWTPDRQAAFLRALAANHCVTHAARSVGMSRQSAYRLRARMKGEPFDLAWHAALRCRFDALAEAALDRAMNGVEVPHFYKGELVHTSRRYDERLTVALLMMRDKLGAPHADHDHPSADYRADPTGAEFAQLVARVEGGPETWEEERVLQIQARREQREREMRADGIAGRDSWGLSSS